MRPAPNPDIEAGRVTDPRRYTPMGAAATDSTYGNNGHFFFKGPAGEELHAIASDGGGWEHVSVSIVRWRILKRCPTWEEMCFIKDLFWDKEETVIQFHPPESEYVRTHDYVLHLWKPTGIVIPLPPTIYVGYKKKRKR